LTQTLLPPGLLVFILTGQAPFPPWHFPLPKDPDERVILSLTEKDRLPFLVFATSIDRSGSSLMGFSPSSVIERDGV